MGRTRSISLALQEGFLDDRIRIRAGGRELAAIDGLSTRVQIGLARALDIEVEEGETLAITLPDKGLHAELDVSSDTPGFVAVSVAPGGESLVVRQTESPPAYL